MDEKLRAFIFGVEWANRWKELIVFQSSSISMRKNTSCGYRREKPQICYKTKQGGGGCVRLMVEISKQQRQTARAKSCCPKGKDGTEGRGSWASMWGGLFLSVLIQPGSREKGTMLSWGTGLWRNITCCEQCRWGCCQGNDVANGNESKQLVFVHLQRRLSHYHSSLARLVC